MCITRTPVKTGLKYLTNVDPESDSEVSKDDIAEERIRTPYGVDAEYLAALKGDVMAASRKIVTSFRASHGRREALKSAIMEGNEKGLFKDKLPVVTLLRDVDTRWSSVYLMGARVKLLHLALEIVVQDKAHEDLHDLLLTPTQRYVLEDICTFLEIFHSAQQLVSADKTPTLFIVIPVYQQLLIMLQNAKNKLPNLAHAIDASYAKLYEYVEKTRSTPTYNLAMKFRELCNKVANIMLEYKRANQIDPPTTMYRRREMHTPSASARAQASGRQRFNALAKSLLTGSNDLPSTTQQVPTSSSEPPTNESLVSEELCEWIATGVMSSEREIDDLDLVSFWRRHRLDFPILYHIALDVLPVQASAVPCERVFSSSKETDSLRRSNMEPRMMEALQILKFRYRSDRLDFSQGRLATEEECTVLDINPSVFDHQGYTMQDVAC